MSGAQMQSDEQRDPLIGQTLDNIFQITARLGSGGMGSLYKATNVQLEQAVALKFVNRSRRTDVKILQRLRREAQILGNLSHPNIVSVKSFHIVDGNDAFLAMEYLEGITLTEFLRKNGPLTGAQFKQIFAQVCSGLSYAHSKGLVHRDLKPDNIMLLEAESENPHVKIVDFGLAKLTAGSEQKLTATGMLVGSLNYISPEQCAGGQLDERADVYSLACLMWESLTGQAPYDADSNMMIIRRHMEQQLPPLPPEQSQALSKILQRCTAVVAENRLRTIDEMWRAIESESQVIVPAPRNKPTVNKRAIAIGSTIAIILALGGAGIFLAMKVIPDMRSQERRRAFAQQQNADFVLAQKAIAEKNYENFVACKDKLFDQHEMTGAYASQIAKGLVAWIPRTTDYERSSLSEIYIDHCLFLSEDQQTRGHSDLAIETVHGMVTELHKLGLDDKAEEVLDKEIGEMHVAHRQYYIAGVLYEDAQLLQRTGRPFLALDRLDAGWAAIRTLVDRYTAGQHTDLPMDAAGKAGPLFLAEIADQNCEAYAQALTEDKQYKKAAQVYQEWLDYMDKLHLVSPIRRDRVQESRDLARAMAEKKD